MGTFDLVAFKVIQGHWMHLGFFRKYDFQKAASTLMMLFQPNFLQVLYVTVRTRVTSWNLEIQNSKPLTRFRMKQIEVWNSVDVCSRHMGQRLPCIFLRYLSHLVHLIGIKEYLCKFTSVTYCFRQADHKGLWTSCSCS